MIGSPGKEMLTKRGEHTNGCSLTIDTLRVSGPPWLTKMFAKKKIKPSCPYGPAALSSVLRKSSWLPVS